MSTYEIPVDLLNDLILTIIGAIVAIGAYMVVWAIADAKHKTLVIGRLNHLEDLIQLHDTYRAGHDKLVEKVDTLEQRMDDSIGRRHNGIL